jgi:uncharacterized protein YbaA (DUF1428 family)
MRGEGKRPWCSRGSCSSHGRLAKMMDPKAMPFDVKRMAYGGFKVLVDL